jgi:transketolase
METLHYVSQSDLDRVRRLTTTDAVRTALFADLCRINTLSMIARAGSGHIGTSFSCLDIVSWLFLNEMRRESDGEGPFRDVYFSSKGHDAPGLYSVMIGIGLLPHDSVRTLRRIGGLPGHPDVSTPHVPTNTGSLGMGISKAKGMVMANRLRRRDARIFVLTGDGELQEGQLWESLVSAANAGMGEITAIVDHNKVQSDTWVATTSDLGDLASKFAAFDWHVARCDGHDLSAIAKVLDEFRAITNRPKVLIADTIKGRGVSFMEHTRLAPEADSLYEFHSGAPAPEHYARGVDELAARVNGVLSGIGADPIGLLTEPWLHRTPPERPERLLQAYSRALVRQAECDPKLVALDADLVLDTGLIDFRKRFPDRFVECGIAEQDMVSQAGGMALSGLLPVVHSFACFLSARPNEQIYNNATEGRKIGYVGALAGLVPAGPGHSHQSVRDIALMGCVPGLVAIEPSCEAEVEMAVDFCLNRTAESFYLRLVSVPWETPFTLPTDYQLCEGRGATLVDGADAVLFAYGPVLLSEAVRAAALLRSREIFLKVINLPWLNRVDLDWLLSEIGSCRHMFAIDNHLLDGGQGEMLAARLTESGWSGLVKRFGVAGVPICGSNEEVIRAHGLDADSLVTGVVAAMHGRAELASARAEIEHKHRLVATLELRKSKLFRLPTADPDLWIESLADGSAAPSELVAQLARWRRSAAAGFTTMFDVTESGTRQWMTAIHERADRILFLVVAGGHPVGHVGLAAFDANGLTCEVWDVVRGEPHAPKGTMAHALRALIAWAYDDLGVDTIRLRVLSELSRALALYHRCGFVAETVIPLSKIVEPGMTRWEPCSASDSVDRFLIQMRHDR